MTNNISRRGFLAATTALAASTALATDLLARPQVLRLTAEARAIDIDGRAATVLGLLNDQGRHGLILEPGQRFQVALRNDLDEETRMTLSWGPVPPRAPSKHLHYDQAPRRMLRRFAASDWH